MTASNEMDSKAKRPADKPGALLSVVVVLSVVVARTFVVVRTVVVVRAVVVVVIISPRVKVTVAKVILACAPISELLFGMIRMITSTGIVAALLKL